MLVEGLMFFQVQKLLQYVPIFVGPFMGLFILHTRDYEKWGIINMEQHLNDNWELRILSA